jgi:hypothetical protein
MWQSLKFPLADLIRVLKNATLALRRRFIYQGVAMFLNPQAWGNSLNFTLISIFAILFGR